MYPGLRYISHVKEKVKFMVKMNDYELDHYLCINYPQEVKKLIIDDILEKQQTRSNLQCLSEP